jgi:hypothetical protein
MNIDVEAQPVAVPHRPSGVVVLKGHPQLGGRYCLTDGGDWPCAAVRAALAATPEPRCEHNIPAAECRVVGCRG